MLLTCCRASEPSHPSYSGLHSCFYPNLMIALNVLEMVVKVTLGCMCTTGSAKCAQPSVSLPATPALGSADEGPLLAGELWWD